ncbi:50S ribosomal protein L4 [Thermaurantimonas aggregans]|uniref:Large ribosomal subunit protein uL4 n=1 Tax=Thermaurantimonas aggregans TaxID=2173829 RepID=A0A401XN40_9FLAO|nr:50S ribosomal protein L4 [Thermaurantimonas aggregans]MCX8149591.1 50S ribosomal protein L4 [Thermaurantimonas aggregans]GCD78431.1 50S ribosomal protein L4 [Thermaurantimonas aggregans]
MELSVYTIEGKDTGRKVTLDERVFGIQPHTQSVYLDIKRYLAHQRQGTHKTKERAEVARTTKKHHRQKGTGGARHGSLKSPIHRGGGTVFGPRPHDYVVRLNIKTIRLARRSALSAKAAENAITVVEDFTLEKPKTKDFLNILKNLQLADKKSLVIIGDKDNNVYLSSRNLEQSKVVIASELNTYQIMNAQNLLISESALGKIQDTLTK